MVTRLPTLQTPGVYGSVLLRIHSLTPTSARAWGTMSVGGMLCHLDDAFTRVPRRDETGTNPARNDTEAAANHGASWIGRRLLRPLALHTPLPWARNMPTVAQVDQLRGGTPPSTFHRDQAKLLASLFLFFHDADWTGRPHPFMGPLTHWEWMRWAWLHTDHHLRQFSA